MAWTMRRLSSSGVLTMLLYTVELRAAPDDALHHPWSDLPGFYRLSCLVPPDVLI
ncbi:unnamed protein product [Musa hybrid cultivar]